MFISLSMELFVVLMKKMGDFCFVFWFTQKCEPHLRETKEAVVCFDGLAVCE